MVDLVFCLLVGWVCKSDGVDVEEQRQQVNVYCDCY